MGERRPVLSIAYISNRKENLIWWFIASLRRQVAQYRKSKPFFPRLIVVDFWNQHMPHHGWTQEKVTARQMALKSMTPDFEIIHVPPKPTPWQGPHRLTSKDYFAASNARNTAILYAKDGHLAYVDDLSVLLPNWLVAVDQACAANRITVGAFKKLKKMVVINGTVKSFEDHPAGVDSRWPDGNDQGPVETAPNRLFGCSLVAPVERFLEINGWPEEADSTGLGCEDCTTGIALANNGHKLYYDRRMLTYESEEHHSQGPVMLRVDKRKPGMTESNGVKHLNEKGHFFVNRHKDAKRFENYFGPEGIAGLRQRVLAGEPIPNTVAPTTDWHDNQPISEL